MVAAVRWLNKTPGSGSNDCTQIVSLPPSLSHSTIPAEGSMTLVYILSALLGADDPTLTLIWPNIIMCSTTLSAITRLAGS